MEIILSIIIQARLYTHSHTFGQAGLCHLSQGCGHDWWNNCDPYSLWPHMCKCPAMQHPRDWHSAQTHLLP